MALGHPIGASGCRLLVTLLYEMIKQDKQVGLVSLLPVAAARPWP
ncbi:MAG: hypothetical protein U5J82_03580 [Desulfobacterales bacterium]|nr:hypothetical protein [Desulfobacterales bacterium]